MARSEGSGGGSRANQDSAANAATATPTGASSGRAPAPTPAEVADTVHGSDESMAQTQHANGTNPTSMTGKVETRVFDNTDSLIGKLIHQRYKIERKIGQGGMGAVYEATHTKIGKRVAIKVLLDRLAEKDQIVARLQQEARLASSIGNEHIIDITDIGQTEEGRTFVVMEYLEGESLGQCLNRNGPLPQGRVISIGRQVANALGAAHNKGIIHRDIKPENVFLLTRKGKDFVKVVDFGISKSMLPGGEGRDSPRLTQTGVVLGTPLYMSPEQARGDDELDHRIDVYAVGVILYEMVTGEVPFHGTNYLNVLAKVVSVEPKPVRDLRPEIDADLEAVINKAMAKELEHRYGSMEELDADLEILESSDPTLSSSGVRVSAYRRPRSNLKILGTVAGIMLLLSAIALIVWVMNPPEEEVVVAPVAAVVVADAAPVAAAADAAPATPVVKAKIVIESTPPGAIVYQGVRKLGETPYLFEPRKVEGDVILHTEAPGYNYDEFKVNPIRDDGTTVSVILRKPAKGKKPTVRPKVDPEAKPPKKAGDKGPDGTAGGDLRPNPFK